MLHTPLHDWHVGHGGKMVEFAGWSMPVYYTSISEEHQAVRERVGLFDISHMARFQVIGSQSTEFLDHLMTADVSAMRSSEIKYSLVCRENGGILDDVLVYRFADYHLVVANASNRAKIWNWMEDHLGAWDVALKDLTESWAMLAVQGPRSIDLLQPLVKANLQPMRYYTGMIAVVSGESGIVSRTGYTGEDGFEVILPSDQAVRFWETLLQAGDQFQIRPCGLGCRDTLRLEAGMPLYGHEMDETIDPITARLGFGVHLEGANFVGKEAILKRKSAGVLQTRVGLKLEGKRIAREGAIVMKQGKQVGRVTSGTYSPTLQQAIAMALVERESTAPGTALEVDLRGQRIAAEVVKLPFYSRTRS
jgi:aminomethyltransferase